MDLDYVTISLPFHATGDVAKSIYWTAWLSKACAHRVFEHVKANLVLAKLSEYDFIKFTRELCYSLLPNRRYVDGVATLVYSSLQSVRKLKVDVSRVELKPWLLFQSEGEPWAKGNLNIQFTDYETVKVLVFKASGGSERVVVKPVVSKRYNRLLKELVDRAMRKEIGYPARVYIRSYSGDLEHLYGELQINVKHSLYLEIMKRFDKPLGSNVAGIDVNTDRLNLVVVNKDGEVVWMHTVRFPQILARGFPRKRAWSIIGEKIHEVLKHAYHHGASAVALENPGVIGYLRYYWVRNGERGGRNYNYKVAVFRSSIIERILWKAPLYGLKIVYVDPKGTTSSREHAETMKKHRLNKHTASAYLIASRALSILERPTKT
ncbi:MAG: hypothetical protein QXS42_05970 [Zestosphaera sp.]